MKKTMLWGIALNLACYAAPASTACTVTATDHAFGNYLPLSGNATDATSDITVNCSGPVGLLVTIAISLGTGSSGSYSPRMMYKSTDTLSYNLYTNAARNTVWGDGTGGTSTIGYTLLLPLLGNDSRTDTVYGRIPANQTTAVPGYYSDIITVTVDYLGL